MAVDVASPGTPRQCLRIPVSSYDTFSAPGPSSVRWVSFITKLFTKPKGVRKSFAKSDAIVAAFVPAGATSGFFISGRTRVLADIVGLLI